MSNISEDIPGYTYGAPEVTRSTLSVSDLASLKISAGFTDEDQRCLRLAGEVLAGQVKQIVDHWRSGIIARIPNLARHSRTPEGKAIPEYLAASNLRFQQWILDTCLRPYDQDWINYQQEPYVPLRDVIAFIAVMNETIRPYLAAKGHSAEEVDKMHRAWCKSIQMQLALWIGPYTDLPQKNEW
jgi:hypothetical protein